MLENGRPQYIASLAAVIPAAVRVAVNSRIATRHQYRSRGSVTSAAGTNTTSLKRNAAATPNRIPAAAEASTRSRRMHRKAATTNTVETGRGSSELPNEISSLLSVTNITASAAMRASAGARRRAANHVSGIAAVEMNATTTLPDRTSVSG